uniref:Thiamin biosynthesis protein S n=1 Tax=Spyridia filamentosa TaxID=196632 RepID=A0A1Z1MKN0_SPYFI|nr:thiamin biosynthesis protein S [Spyridia filamentosa]ARW66301.1 thiamin biosynthesis protein S [Spyridia filamentosa]
MNIKYSTIFVNGQPFNCFNNMSLKDILLYLDFNIDAVIIEYNKSQILRPNSFDSFYLNNNDSLEIITIVGGG